MQTTQSLDLNVDIYQHVLAHRDQYDKAIASVVAMLDGPETKVERLGRAMSQELEIADTGPPGLLPTKEHAKVILTQHCVATDPDVRDIDPRLDLGIGADKCWEREDRDEHGVEVLRVVMQKPNLSHELMRSMLAISLPPADRVIDGTSRAELDCKAWALWDELVGKAWAVERPREQPADSNANLAPDQIVDLVETKMQDGAVEASKEAEPRTREQWLATALLLRRDNPKWSLRRIAREIGISHSQLSRCPEFRRATEIACGEPPPIGFVTKNTETGHWDQIEAIDPETDE